MAFHAVFVSHQHVGIDPLRVRSFCFGRVEVLRAFRGAGAAPIARVVNVQRSDSENEKGYASAPAVTPVPVDVRAGAAMQYVERDRGNGHENVEPVHEVAGQRPFGKLEILEDLDEEQAG